MVREGTLAVVRTSSTEQQNSNWRQCTRILSASACGRALVVDRLPIELPYLKGVTNKIGHLLHRCLREFSALTCN